MMSKVVKLALNCRGGRVVEDVTKKSQRDGQPLKDSESDALDASRGHVFWLPGRAKRLGWWPVELP